jgi:hypothetical protein
MPGAMLEIACAEPRRLRDVLHGLPGVVSVLLVGIGAHVHVDDASARQPQIAAALAAAGVPITAMAQVAPSIEDLFVAFLADGAAQ